MKESHLNSFWNRGTTELGNGLFEVSNLSFSQLDTHVIRTSIITSHCFQQFSNPVKGVADVFAEKKYSKNIFNFEICYRYDEGSNRAVWSRPILKSLARLLPDLYSTRSNCYYQYLLGKLQALVAHN